ncbi:hypothetical protein [Mycolicibacter longobardus]|nr:hypothetical protein [Mycolicibacter longobardus]
MTSPQPLRVTPAGLRRLAQRCQALAPHSGADGGADGLRTPR